MKNIISDYIYLRMAFSFAVITLSAAVFFFSGFHWITFGIALLNIFACFDTAIEIADFEMSDIGESGGCKRVDVYFTK